MKDSHRRYESPFSSRYASSEMSYIFSSHFRISTFRKLWASLAKAQKKQGLSITHEQIAALEDHIENIDFTAVHIYEKKFKHDVMAHIHAFGDLCPQAKGILHLGATSTFVTDNADLIQMKEALFLLFKKIKALLQIMAKLAKKESSSFCLGYTHFQPAQPTTVGKRISLWLQDFLFDAKDFARVLRELPFLGAKGATGTQSSFLALFEGDEKKVKEMEKDLQEDFGFSSTLPIAAQTYTRKIDLTVLQLLSSFAASAHKMGTDLRLLAHEKELFEGFSQDQVGSSAMPYKKNPIYAERICGLARFVISLSQNPSYTLATQWLERSLDDSSNRRLSISESFLGADSILNLLIHLTKHLHIDQEQTKKNLEEKMEFLCMENLLMLAVKKGADRQQAHELLRKAFLQKNPFIAQELGLSEEEIKPYLKPESLIGRAKTQVEEFLKEELEPFFSQYPLEEDLILPEIHI